MYNRKPAKLILENGRFFYGYALGKEGITIGELCFNTGMTGYQEILTDPSYCGQLVTMTTPHIGNYGINLEDTESKKVQVQGFIIKEEYLNGVHFVRLEIDKKYFDIEKLLNEGE